jgi:hypothetical protein
MGIGGKSRKKVIPGDLAAEGLQRSLRGAESPVKNPI